MAATSGKGNVDGGNTGRIGRVVDNIPFKQLNKVSASKGQGARPISTATSLTASETCNDSLSPRSSQSNVSAQNSNNNNIGQHDSSNSVVPLSDESISMLTELESIELCKLKQIVSELQSQVQQTNEEIQNVKEDTGEAEKTTSLVQFVAELVADVSTESSTLKVDVDDMRRDIQTNQSNINDHTDTMDSLHRKYHRSEKELQRTKLHLQDILCQLKVMREEQVVHRAQLNVHDEQLNQHEGRLDGLDRKVDELSHFMGELSRQTSADIAEVSQMHNDGKKKIDHLQREIEGMIEDDDIPGKVMGAGYNVLEMMNELQCHLSDLANKVETQQNEIRSLSFATRGNETNLSNMNETVQQQLAEASTYKVCLKEFSDQMGTLSEAVKEIETSQDISNATLEELCISQDETSARLDKLDVLVVTNAEQLQGLKKSHEAMKQKVDKILVSLECLELVTKKISSDKPTIVTGAAVSLLYYVPRCFWSCLYISSISLVTFSS